MMKAIFKEIEYGSQSWRDAVSLREKVLRVPLGSQFSAKELEEERNHHQIAGFINERLVATAVLVPEADKMKMQRVVVEEELRSSAIGSAMMVFCEVFALEKQAQLIYCHARDTAVNFYKKNNYEPVGDYFDEDGIPHLKMIKRL